MTEAHWRIYTERGSLRATPYLEQTEERFLALVHPQWRRLHAVARQYIRHTEDAHDLVQEAVLRAWRSFASAGDRAYKPAWLFTIMRNVALEWRRQAGSRVRLTLVPDSELTELMPADHGEPFHALPVMSESQFREFLDQRLAHAVESLDGPFREVLILSVAGGLSYSEIAQVLDCPLGTVMSRMGRARRLLREYLARTAGVKSREQWS